MANYNADAWRLVAEKVKEEIAAAITAHETKAAGDDFASSHVPSNG